MPKVAGELHINVFVDGIAQKAFVEAVEDIARDYGVCIESICFDWESSFTSAPLVSSCSIKSSSKLGAKKCKF